MLDNPVDHFPVHQQSEDQLAKLAKARAEADTPLDVHYDATLEPRAKGAANYQFSTDEETRKAEMAALRAAREETKRIRRDAGATDLKPGEVEGMKPQAGSELKSKPMEERKRKLEERRKLLDAKRRKVKADDSEPGPAPAASKPVVSVAPPSDPMAVLEAGVNMTYTAKETPKASKSTAADDFLAQLENDIFKDKSK
jgi:hypothetical protein